MRPDQVVDLDHLDDVPAEKIPAALAQLAAAQGMLAARLLSNGNGSHTNAKAKLLDINEAAARIGKSVDWVYRNKSDLPFIVRVGRSLKFSEVGLEKWIRNKSG